MQAKQPTIATCQQYFCRHGNHSSASAPREMAEFVAGFLFSLGFSERLVNPRKTLDIHVLLAELFRTSKTSFSALALALCYMKRYATNNPANLQYSVYPVFVTALMAASKYLEDNTYTNRTWSTLTGFKLLELNGLEMHFLQALNFRMHVSELEYSEWLATLLAYSLQQQQQLQQQQLQQQHLHQLLHYQQKELLLHTLSSSAEDDGAVLAMMTGGHMSPASSSSLSPMVTTPVAAPLSPAGARTRNPHLQGQQHLHAAQGAVQSQLVHLQAHHFGMVLRSQWPPTPTSPAAVLIGTTEPSTLKARPRSKSPSSLHRQLPPIASLLSGSAPLKHHSPIASPFSKYRPYPELASRLAAHQQQQQQLPQKLAQHQSLPWTPIENFLGRTTF